MIICCSAIGRNAEEEHGKIGTFVFRNRQVRLVETIDDMVTFSQMDDHIMTLIKHSTHPQMSKAKEIINQIEHRSKCDERGGTEAKSVDLLDIYRYIGNTYVPSTVHFNKRNCKTSCQEIVDCCQFEDETPSITARDLIIQVSSSVHWF